MIKLTENSKLYIWCNSSEVLSGGAEVLNKLGADLKKMGVNAKLFNSGVSGVYKQNPYYENLYDVDCCDSYEIIDDENTVILVPEIMIEDPITLDNWCNMKNIQFIIWWLGSGFDYNDKTIKTSKRLIMNKLKSIEDRSLNLYENTMCRQDLLYHGLHNIMQLQHGVHPAFYDPEIKCPKENVVIYNGYKASTKEFVEEHIVPFMPNVTFDSISASTTDHYLTKEELVEHYDRAKVYIDFCEFEGREMMPREACLRNCILILPNENNAGVFEEYPIPEIFKINKYENPLFIRQKIASSLSRYDACISRFQLCKNKFLHEPERWHSSLQIIFGSMVKQNKSL